MGESNGDWGELASQSLELADMWDGYSPLPESGANPYLDAFVAKKHLTIAALLRVGARLSEPTVLAFAGPGYLKYRDVVTDKRWNEDKVAPVRFTVPRVVRAGPEPADVVILAEGETDAARLTLAYPTCDVAIMAAGAEFFPPSYTEALTGYRLVLVGHDTDAAGERGAAKALAALPQAVRFAPPANDWCSVDGEFPELPPVPDKPATRFVFAGEMLNMEVPRVQSWFENALLPVNGSLIMHGWVKAFKSYMALDMLAALAQGQPWAGFESTTGDPVVVGVLQYEVQWSFYRDRVALLHDRAVDVKAFDSHFATLSPIAPPRFIAGNQAHEDELLRDLESAGVQVFLLDPVRRFTGFADLNSEQEVRRLLAFIDRLNQNGVTVVACHHDNKTASRTGGGDPLGMTGAGAFAGDADTIVSISQPKDAVPRDLRRNLHFTLRNGPAPAPRGIRMISDETRIEYSLEAHGSEEGASPSSDDRLEPPI